MITERLADHPDVMLTKLAAGKVTYVHRRLWSAVYAIARSNESWQSKRLPSAARAIMTRLRKVGWVQTDQLPRGKTNWKAATIDLERRLLVFSQDVHTESGSHAKQLESWEHWARRQKTAVPRMTVARSKAQLEDATVSLGAPTGRLLPWSGDNNRR